MVYHCRAIQRFPRLDLVPPGSVLAVDCEGVILSNEVGWEKNGCGRVSIVNEKEEVVYDTFVHYGKHVPHRPPPQYLNLGVKYNDINPKYGALYIGQVTRDVTSLFDRASVVVGHAIKHEKQYLRYVPWEKYQTRDTQQMFRNETSSMKLSTIVGLVLDRQIQTADHSSIEDAQATMALYQFKQKQAMAIKHQLSESGGNIWNEADSALSARPSRTDDQELAVHRATIPTWVAPGCLVAMPHLRDMAKSRRFDPRTSTYY